MEIPTLDIQNIDTLDIEAQQLSIEVKPIEADIKPLDVQPLDVEPVQIDIQPLAIDVQPLDISLTDEPASAPRAQQAAHKRAGARRKAAPMEKGKEI